MVREKYGVRLTPEQRNQLEHLVRAGKSTARVTTRARILLKTDAGWAAPRVAEALDVAEGTVFRIKGFAEAGLAGALQDRVQANRYRKLEDRGEAHLIALACSPAPEGHAHWTLRLLAGKVVELGLAGVPRDGAPAAQKNALKPWQKKEWCIPKVSADFVAHMEEVLDLYAEPYDPKRPVVCFDETSTQLLAETQPACRPSRDTPCGRTTSTAEKAPAICSWPVNRWPVGATWRLLNGARCRTSPSRCAGWWMKPTRR